MKKPRVHMLHILYWLILSVPVSLCTILFIFCRDIKDIRMMIAGNYSTAALISSMIILFLQQKEPKIRQHLIPILFVPPLGLLTLATASTAAWLFLLLMSICVGMLLRSAAVALTAFIHKKRRMKDVKQPAETQPAETQPADPPDQIAPRSHGEPSAITFPVKDVIKERLARCQYWNLWYGLHAISDYDGHTGIHYGKLWQINRMTGEPRLLTSMQENHSSYTQLSIQNCTEMDIRRCGNEKLKDFTTENWRDYVPDKPLDPISQKSAMVVPAEACRPGKKVDVDAYFLVSSHQIDAYYYEHQIIYLRCCDTGWRLFLHSREHTYIPRKIMTDEALLKQLAEEPYVYDRLLTADETAYMMHLLPDRHDGVQGARSAQCFVHGQKGPLEACYWKDGYCVDCAQLPHIPKLFEKLAELAERGLSVEGADSGQEA